MSRRSSCNASNNSSLDGRCTKRGMSDSLNSALSWLWDLCRRGNFTPERTSLVGCPSHVCPWTRTCSLCVLALSSPHVGHHGWGNNNKLETHGGSVINCEMRGASEGFPDKNAAFILSVCHPLHHLLLCDRGVILPLPHTEWRNDNRIAKQMLTQLLLQFHHHLLETGHLGGCICNWCGRGGLAVRVALPSTLPTASRSTSAAHFWALSMNASLARICVSKGCSCASFCARFNAETRVSISASGSTRSDATSCSRTRFSAFAFSILAWTECGQRLLPNCRLLLKTVNLLHRLQWPTSARASCQRPRTRGCGFRFNSQPRMTLCGNCVPSLKSSHKRTKEVESTSVHVWAMHRLRENNLGQKNASKFVWVVLETSMFFSGIGNDSSFSVLHRHPEVSLEVVKVETLLIPKKISVTFSSNWVFPCQGGRSHFLISSQIICSSIPFQIDGFLSRFWQK